MLKKAPAFHPVDDPYKWVNEIEDRWEPGSSDAPVCCEAEGVPVAQCQEGWAEKGEDNELHHHWKTLIAACARLLNNLEKPYEISDD